VLKEIFQNRVHPISFSIIEIITRKNREELLPSIATEFHKLYNSHKNIQVAEVTTTYPLDAGQRQEFTDLVKRVSGKQVELREKVDPALIGGFVLQVGDQQIDESIKTKLQRLKYQMVKS
jgi:F-type H+-transporting ATPase subunit delta